MVHPDGAGRAEAVEEAEEEVEEVDIELEVDEDEDVDDEEEDEDEDEEELEDAPFLWYTVNLQLPPQISDASPAQFETQSATPTF